MNTANEAAATTWTIRSREVRSALLALAALAALLACGGESPPGAPDGGGATPAETARTKGSPSTPAGYSVAEIPRPGRIAGRVELEGTPPEPEPVTITKDKEVCAAHQHRSEALVVGPEGGVSDAVVAIESIASGKPFPAVERAVLDQRGCWFVPHIQLLPAGAEIDILNSDGILHNLHTFSESNPAINVAQPKFKKRITQSFAAPERVRVVCDVHGWMSAWIVVIGHPYHVLTTPDGNFTLDEVPPGQYTLTVWHETLGAQKREVTVEPDGSVEAVFTFGT